MSGKKRRLSRHDDQPGSALSLYHLWEAVPATEEVDGDDEAFTDEMWTYYAHQIARESEQPEGIPNLRSPLGPLDDGNIRE
jgi:hypothetical protein